MSEDTKTEETRLAVILEENKLDPQETKDEQKVFSPFFEQVDKMREACLDINITSVDQFEEMERAREFRLELKKIRVTGEKEKNRLKERPLRMCQAIDALNRYLRSEIEPLEEHLRKQEDFVAREEERIKVETEEKRKAELDQYEADYEFVDLREMPEENYKTFLTNAKKNFELKKAEAEREEKERAEAEEKKRFEEYKQTKIESLKEQMGGWGVEIPVDFKTLQGAESRESFDKQMHAVLIKFNEEVAKIKAENARLKAEAEEKAKKEAAEKKKAEEEEKKREAARQAELEAERKKAEKAEAELKAKEEEEKRKKAEAEEKERQAQLAPDKVKLQQLAVKVAELEMPEVKTEEAKKIVAHCVELLNKTSNYIKQNTINL